MDYSQFISYNNQPFWSEIQRDNLGDEDKIFKHYHHFKKIFGDGAKVFDELKIFILFLIYT